MPVKRGRKSASHLAAVAPVKFGEKPPPPHHLNARQAEIWVETVASEANSFFSTAVLKSMLADYCMRKESAEIISEVINTFKPEWLKNTEGAKRYKELLHMRDLEQKGYASLATKLRLTNQSRYTPQAASTSSKHNKVGAKPWES